MNILFISIAWPPSGERNLYTDLMDEFVLNGHKVYAVGTHISKNLPKTEMKEENGITVLRIYSGKIRKTSYIRKATSLLNLNGRIWRALKKNLGGKSIDLIIGPTPPITLSQLFKKLKKKYNAPFYLLLKDIWPQGSVDLSVFRKYSIPWMYLRLHESKIYQTANYIGCMSPKGVDYIISNNSFISKSKVEVCPNCIRPNNVLVKNSVKDIRLKHNIPTDACVFIFSGNLGKGHGLSFLVDAIKLLSGYSKAFFVIGGSGTQYKYLKESLMNISPKNVLLYEWLPREDYQQILFASDVGLILLHKYTVPQFPSRLLSYLELSIPVLCAVNKETDIGTIVEGSGCGRSIIHGNMEAFINEIKYFAENANERMKMGINAYKLLLNKYTTANGYKIIMNHFQ
jgi:glycosyltransferase involved in cell wall biosynthesis